ncbi:NirD/YgiW/YdeI family stress tolerance protein [Enterobacteriaceae bacterium 4M9]|nr:NirD/YgiW/YdeI family stress tolerance protein [Enterobacteriaceae bacterium 4M9]
MHKTWIVVCLLMILPALFIQQQGGFSANKTSRAQVQDGGSNDKEDKRSMTVEQAKMLDDGASLVLSGHLIKQTGHDSYQFRDKSGTLDVVIPPAVFEARELSPDNLLTISGSWDKSHLPPMMQVDTIETAR